MKVGDLVKHNPAKSTHPSMKKLYNDWGHERDFSVGLIVDTKVKTNCGFGDSEEKRFFAISTAGKKPAWYETSELEAINEHQS